MCVCVCTCSPRLSPCGCYFRSYEGILSLPPPSLPTTGVRFGLGKERKMGFGGAGKGTEGMVMGGRAGEKNRINSGIKAFLCGFDFFPK